MLANTPAALQLEVQKQQAHCALLKALVRRMLPILMRAALHNSAIAEDCQQLSSQAKRLGVENA